MIKTKFTIHGIEGKQKKMFRIPYRVDAARKKILKQYALDHNTSIQALIDQALEALLKNPPIVLHRTKSHEE